MSTQAGWNLKILSKLKKCFFPETIRIQIFVKRYMHYFLNTPLIKDIT